MQEEIQDGRKLPNPYTFSERLARLLWIVIRFVLYRPIPRIFNGWHRFVLRVFGAEIGEGTLIYPSAEIYFPWRLRTGSFCVIGDRVKLYSLGFIVIGRHTVISQHVHLCAGTHDYSDLCMPLIREDIHLGEGCWICADAFVGPGVTVGNHTVVGARSVVVRSLPPRMVCAGNPCRPLKCRTIRNAT